MLDAILLRTHLDGIGDLATRLGHDLLHPNGDVETVVQVRGLLEEALSRADGGRGSRHVRHAVPLVREHSGVSLLLRDDLRREESGFTEQGAAATRYAEKTRDTSRQAVGL